MQSILFDYSLHVPACHAHPLVMPTRLSCWKHLLFKPRAAQPSPACEGSHGRIESPEKAVPYGMTWLGAAQPSPACEGSHGRIESPEKAVPYGMTWLGAAQPSPACEGSHGRIESPEKAVPYGMTWLGAAQQSPYRMTYGGWVWLPLS
jgi:CDGSH-type Zn-finger protein